MENSVIKVAMLLLKRCKLEGKYGSCVRLAELMTWAAEGLTESTYVPGTRARAGCGMGQREQKGGGLSESLWGAAEFPEQVHTFMFLTGP